MNHWKLLIFCLSMLLFLLVTSCAIAEEESIQALIDIQYRYDCTESMLPLINEFRTGSDAWYWNDDNKTKTVLTDLEPMTYDYGLECVAMQRAAECALLFDHVRPNGNICLEIYPEGTVGENIAAGYGSVYNVFIGWREDDVGYSGQGHRRNMLEPNYLFVGVGCVWVNGVYYWCQAFSSEPTNEARNEFSSPAIIATTPDMLSVIGFSKASVSPKSLFLTAGETADAPAMAGFSGIWGDTAVTLHHLQWKSSDPAVVKVSGSLVTGISGGKAKLTLYLLDQTWTVDVTVVCADHTWDQGAVILEPTVAALGKMLYTCTVCGETREEEIPSPNVLLGDVTGDGTLDGRDALRLMKYLSGQDVTIDEAAADMNGDGILDGRDVLRLLKTLAGQ